METNNWEKDFCYNLRISLYICYSLNVKLFLRAEGRHHRKSVLLNAQYI